MHLISAGEIEGPFGDLGTSCILRIICPIPSEKYDFPPNLSPKFYQFSTS